MTTQSEHGNGEWLVPRTVRRYMAINVDKAHQRHSIETLPAGYIGKDDNTECPWQW